MTGRTYRSLIAEFTADGVFQARDLYGLLTVLVELAVYALGFAVLLAARPFSWLYWASEVFLGFSMFRFFVILHECGHKTLFRKRLACTFFGTLASLFCLVPYVPWRNIHYLHHKWVGVIDKDPTQSALLDVKNQSDTMNFLFRWVWRLWLPLVFVVFLFRVFWAYPFNEYRKGNRTDALHGLVSAIVCVLPRIALLATLGLSKSLVLFLPMTLLYLFIFENVSLPQHTSLFPYLSDGHPAPIPLWEQDTVTRTTSKASPLLVLLSYNFNLHTEHHLFPATPWYRLPKVSRRIAGMDGYQKVNFIEYMMQIRGEDPVEIYLRSLPEPGRRPEIPQDDPAAVDTAAQLLPP